MIVDEQQPQRRHPAMLARGAPAAGAGATPARPPPAAPARSPSPPPARSRPSSVPPSRSARSRIPRSPWPPSRARAPPPRPGRSRVRRRSRRARRCRRSRSASRTRCRAAACRRALASASWAARRTVTSTSGWSGRGSPEIVSSAPRRPRRDARARARPAVHRPRAPAGGAPRPGRAPRPGERAPPPAARACASRARPGSAVEHRIRRLEVRDHAREPLRERVVDLARQPGALFRDARLALGGRELRARRGQLR